MYTMDFEFMYTNIDIDVFLDIIKEDFNDDIKVSFKISQDQLIFFLTTVLVTFNYIIAPGQTKDVVLKQSKVPMGGTLSYFISEIVTGKAIARLLDMMPPRSISFLYKYVDDIFLGTNQVDLVQIPENLKVLLPKINLTITEENERNEIIFLEFIAVRKGRNMRFEWYRKKYGSDGMVDYFSGHRLGMKMDLYKDMFRRAIRLSLGSNKIKIMKDFIRIMEDNHYPLELIGRIIDNNNLISISDNEDGEILTLTKKKEHLQD